jgi:serine/threonine-protein kinase
VTDERWRQVKELFLAAVEQPADARDALIDAALTDDEVRREVRTLIASDASDGSYLDRLPLVAEIRLAAASSRATLAPGTRIAHYEILALAGQGSMGDVYRAHDTTLNRDVALKVLSPELAVDADFLVRFRREAQMLATLNHQNIAGIYGVAEGAGVTALVLEFAGGTTLAEGIAAGPLACEEALRIARQVAAGLEAAHEKGIVHRDLKPANIKVQPDGTVKILDFGLAKIAAYQSTRVTIPAISPDATQEGLIVGTAAYMSPEQACGKPVDRRTDLWSFGVILMEMLTGRRVFTGEMASDVIAAVLKTEPDWTALPVDAPASVRRLLRRCLEKDPRRRRESAADARLDIDDALEPPTVSAADERHAPERSYLTVGASAAAGALLLALAWSAWLRVQQPSAVTIPVRFTVEAAPGALFRPLRTSPDLAVSPDGTRLVYVVGSVPGSADQHLETRTVDSLAASPLGDLQGEFSPVFSPDGQSVAFWGGRIAPHDGLWRVPIKGGAPVWICAPIPHGSGIRGMAWADDDVIWFATADPTTGLWRVPARGGGEPILVTKADSAHGELDHLFPDALPHGRGVLFTVTFAGGASKSHVAVLDLRTGRIKTLIDGGQAKYLKTGHLLYVSGQSVRAVAFNPETLSITGDPVTVLTGLRTDDDTGAGDFAVSDGGTLAYVPAAVPEPRTLTWVDRSGHEEAIAAPARPYTRARVSPDGTRIALSITDRGRDIWVWDIARQALTQITTDPMLDDAPTWNGNDRIVFESNRTGVANVYSHAADGTGDDVRLTTGSLAQRPDSFAPGGRLVFTETLPRSNWRLMLLSPQTNEGASSLALSPPFNRNGEISPNGRWIAYSSDRDELFVSPFPDVSRARWRISRAFGVTPAWSRDGRELFYRAADDPESSDRKSDIVAVSVSPGPDFHASTPTALFRFAYRGYNVGDRTYDVARDGRFVMIKDAPPPDEKPHFVVVLNWFDDLKRLVNAK